MKKLLFSAAMLLALTASISSCKKDKEDDVKTTDTTGTDTTGTGTGPGTGPGPTVIPQVEVSGEITTNTTWTADKVYLMTAKIWVNNGATLTIEPGTIIKAKEQSNPSDAVALIVAAGGKIMAEGTAAKPIIFTSELDDIKKYSDGSVKAGTKGSSAKGLWGGLVLVGKATVDIKDEVAGQLIEGVASTEARGLYGAGGNFNDGDNSGSLKYVSIRHGGASVSADSEINGLSLYGVGSGTTIDYIEIFANNDDGIEFFGGTVKVTHALVTDCADDSFDWDQGYSGKGQFWCTIQDATSDKGFECDGGEGTLTPNSIPTIANFTLIGNNASYAIHYKKKTGGLLYNGLIKNFVNGINLEQIVDADVSFNGIKMDGGTNAMYDANGAVTTSSTFTIVDVTKGTLSISGSKVIPSSTDASTTVATPAGLTTAAYKGAFDPTSTTSWAANWTRSWELSKID